jgi:hypothetical protein
MVCLVAGIGLLAWWIISDSSPAERPSVFDINGDHPGDLRPGLAFTDNLNHYGIDVDLPYEVTINTLGFRGGEPATKGAPVVVVLGDSFAFGMGVDTGHTFPEGLQRALRGTHPNAVVHNAAVPGYTITDELEFWREKLKALAPDLVLVCHTASDLKEMARPTSFRRIVRYDDEEPGPDDPDVERLIAEAGGEKRAVMERHYIVTQEELLSRLGFERAPEILRGYLNEYASKVDELREAIRTSPGAPRFALVLWVDGYGMRDLTSQPIRAFAAERGIPLFDGDAALRSHTKVSPDVLFLPDGHFSSQGNALVGQQTAAWLRSMDLLDAARPSLGGGKVN